MGSETSRHFWNFGEVSFSVSSGDKSIVEDLSRLFCPGLWRGDLPFPLCRPSHRHWEIVGNETEWTIFQEDDQSRGESFQEREFLAHYLEYQVCGEIMRQAVSSLPLHAALVELRPHGGALLAGTAGSGKSTLSVALWESGMDLLGDDRCLIQRHQSCFYGVPLLRRISLRLESKSLLSFETSRTIKESVHFSRLTVQGEDRELFQPQSVRPHASPDLAVPVRAIFILRPDFSDNGEPVRLTQGRALEALIHSTYLRPDATLPELIAGTLDLVEGVPVYALPRQRLPLMIDQIRKILETFHS